MTSQNGANSGGSEPHSPSSDVDVIGDRWTPMQVGLFVASLITMTAAGLAASELDPFAPSQWWGPEFATALSYTISLVAIVGAHEAGHYLTARRRGVEVSRPYFLPGLGPIPGVGVIPFFGTFGAFIKMKWQKMKAPDMLAIAGWGPVAGFVVTVVAVFAGVALSEPVVISDEDELLLLGDPLLIMAATELFHPDLPANAELMLHPVGLAGWVGCLLTALNLLPVGQLDGGHILYGVFGERAQNLAVFAFVALLMMGILYFPGWLLLAALVWWMGVKHPPMLEGPPAGRGERAMAWVCLVIFALTFTPAPVVVDALPQWLGW